MILFLRFNRATLLLTRGMGVSLRHQQALEAAIRVRNQRGLAQAALPLRVFLGQDVALVGVVAAQLSRSREPDPLPERALGFLLRHVNLWVWGLGPGGWGRPQSPGPSPYFGPSTIVILRPSSRGSCSILPTSFSSLATRSSTSRPSSVWAICRPRYIIVTFTLFPSCKNSRAWRVLNSKSWAEIPGRYFTSFR